MLAVTKSSSDKDIEVQVSDWLSQHWTVDVANEAAVDQEAMQRWIVKVYEAGLAAPSWSSTFKGLELTKSQCLIIARKFAEQKAPGAYRERYHLGAATVYSEGSVDLKRELLPKLITGPICCLLYSEPGAGSDLASVRTRAEKIDGHYKITGQKIWTSNALDADYALLLARTNWDVPKHQGITFFIFPMRQDGVEIRPINQITGESEFNEVFLSEAVVPASYVLGEVDKGWHSFQSAIAHERLIMGQGITARRTNVSKGGESPLISIARRYGRYETSDDRQRIAQALAFRELNRLTGERARRDTARRGMSPLSLLGKLAMSRIQHGEAALATDLMGNHSLLDGDCYPDAAGVNFDAAKAYMNSIGGGTDQIQKNMIAERLLGLPRELDVSKDIPFKDVKSG